MDEIAVRIMAGEKFCPGEIKAIMAGRIHTHVRMHETGECTIPSATKSGRIHPMCTEEDKEFADLLLTEAAELCECGEHK